MIRKVDLSWLNWLGGWEELIFYVSWQVGKCWSMSWIVARMLNLAIREEKRRKIEVPSDRECHVARAKVFSTF